MVGVDPPDHPDAGVRPVVDDGGAAMRRLKGDMSEDILAC